MGGVGKTELALQVAHCARAEKGLFPGGILFIDLSGYDEKRYLSPDRALTNLLLALGVSEDQVPADLQGRGRLYRSILTAYAEEGSRILVVLDNASSGAQVLPLLPSDGVNVGLVTSRDFMDVGARVHQIAPLEVVPAIEVLRSILEVSFGGVDERIEAEPASARELSRLCGYLPLALRICAAILVDTPRRPISSLVESLHGAGNLLDRLRREDQEVRAVLDLSYERLTDDQKRLLGFISFTPGSDISTDAAARLLDVSSGVVEDLLIEISRAHLIEQGAEWGRWRLHDLVRRYALEMVAEVVGQEDALVRVLDYYRDHSHAASLALGGDLSLGVFASREIALRWFDAEYENLLHAVDVTGGHRGLIWFAVDMPHRLARYLDARRLYSEWKDMMTLSLRLLKGGDHREFEGSALNSLGMAYREMHQTDRAVESHEAAIAIARDLGDDEMLARYLNNAGNAFLDARNLNGALEAHSEAASLFLLQGDSLGFARATDNAASALRELGRPAEALIRHEEAIATFREFGESGSEAVALTHLGSTLNDLGRNEEAADAHRQSAELLSAQGRTGAASRALYNLAIVLREMGDAEASLLACQESLTLCSLNDDRFGEAQALNQLGLLHMDGNRFGQAVDSFERSIESLSGFEDLMLIGYAWANLGRTHAYMGQAAKAIEKFRNADELFSRLNATDDQFVVRQIVGYLSLQLAHEERNGNG
jgi:tetratricopeptide (TPR) repeat protein